MIDQSNADYEFSYAVFHKGHLEKQLFFSVYFWQAALSQRFCETVL